MQILRVKEGEKYGFMHFVFKEKATGDTLQDETRDTDLATFRLKIMEPREWMKSLKA